MKALLKKEFLVLYREPKFWAPFSLPPLLLIISQIILGSDLSELPDNNPFESSMLILTGVLLSTMGIGLTADSFAGEKERNTLEVLISLPVKFYSLYFSKLIASIFFPAFFSLIWQSLYWLNMSSEDFSILIKAWVCSLSILLFISGFSISFSMMVDTVRSAAQLSMLIFLGVVLILQGWGTEWYLTTPAAFWILPLICSACFGITSLWGYKKFSNIGVRL